MRRIDGYHIKMRRALLIYLSIAIERYKGNVKVQTGLRKCALHARRAALALRLVDAIWKNDNANTNDLRCQWLQRRIDRAGG